MSIQFSRLNRLVLAFATATIYSGLVFAHGGDSHGSSSSSLQINDRHDHDHQDRSNFGFSFDATRSGGLNTSPRKPVNEDLEPSITLNETVLSGSGTYSLSDSLTLSLNVQYIQPAGIEDPSLGALMVAPMPFKRVNWTTFTSFAAPLSEGSKKQDKLFTWNIATGPRFNGIKWGGRLLATASVPSYSDNEQKLEGTPQRGLGETVDPTNTADEHHGDGHHDHQHVAWAERARVGGILGGYFQFAKSFRVDSSAELSSIGRYIGPNTFACELQVFKVSYIQRLYEFGAGLSFKDERDTVQLPAHPIGKVNLTISI